MKRHTKWLFAALFVLAGVLFLPKAQTEVQAAARINYTSLKLKQGTTKKLKIKDSSAKVQWSSSKPNVVAVNKRDELPLSRAARRLSPQRPGKRVSLQGDGDGVKHQHPDTQQRNKIYVEGQNTKVISWSSNNEKIAKVSKKGVVKAKKTGKTVIKCKTTSGTLKCKVYVAALNTTSLRLAVGSQYQLSVSKTGDDCRWSSANASVASVDANGVVTANGYGGTTTITCKTGKAALQCTVKAVSPGNITTPTSALPSTSVADVLDVTVESYPGTRTYTVYRQSASVNKTSGDNGVYSGYMPAHGCAACAVSTVLSGYSGMKMGPIYMTESIERRIFGTAWQENYSKAQSKQMPVSLYGITKILDAYNVSNEYVRQFDQATAVQQITNHLKTGNAVIIEVKKIGSDAKWSNSKHTLVLLGMTDNGYAIVADSADRADYFGDQRRIKYATVMELVQYMFPCTNPTSTSVYYTSESACGGYILVNPQ